MNAHSLATAISLVLFCAAANTAPAAAKNAAPEAPAPDPAATKAMVTAAGAILRGSSADALKELRQLPDEAFTGEDASIRTCMINRFNRNTPPPLAASVEDPFVRAVLAAYQDYWWHALSRPEERKTLEAQLQASLRNLLGEAGKAPKDMNALENLLQAELKNRGYYAQLGTTTPLRDLMLWRTQTTQEFEVPLVDAPYKVRAELLDDFASIGWSHYGSCGKTANGGWATGDAIYAILPRYKGGVADEVFQVVFLYHEGQHFADKNRFPGLESWELEYRGKLAELVRATGELSKKRLLGMISAQGKSPDAAHPYANTQVVRALTQKLGQAPDTVSVEALQKAATELLQEDSRRRRLTKS